MSFSKECTYGAIHEGEPGGKIEQIGGIDTYVALPEGDYPKDKAVLFLTDIFGVALVNNKLLCDAFAKNGFQVYMPDLFHGDPIPVDGMNSPGFDRATWSAKHGRETVRAALDPFVAALTAQGITHLGATGYCFGAKYAVELAQENAIAAASLAHPSRIAVPQDFALLLDKSRVPLQINSCEVDNAFPAEACATADEMLGGGKYAPGYERTYWEGCSHGFAVRGDLSKPLVKAGKEGAFKAAAEFFMKHL